MSIQILARSPPANKKQPLLSSEETLSSAIKTPPAPSIAASEKKRKNIGETIGGAAAECAAVCCCCPCAALDLLLLAVYRVPTAVCKKAWRSSKRHRIMRKKRQGLLVETPKGVNESQRGKVVTGDLTAEMESYKKEGETEAVDFENEMWDRFYGTGFWRSPSMKET